MLLCNYFNYIDQMEPEGGRDNVRSAANQKESYIVLGEAIPNGECWYVMRKNKHNDRDVELWNPMKGISSSFGKVKEATRSAVTKNVGKQNVKRANDPRCQLKRLW